MRKISEDEAIKVCKLDKGNGVCIINASDYYQKLDVIVDDKLMFRKVLFVLTTKKISTCTKSLWVNVASSLKYYDNNHYFAGIVDKKTK